MEQQKYQIVKPVYVKTRKRVGCGPSSGYGKTCGKGMNGQKCRSGYKYRAWFEGGQMPLQRRVPKRGFNNLFKKEFQIVNLTNLENLDINEINPETLMAKGLIKNENKLIKILGKGELKKALQIEADAFSKAAIEKIQAAGGEISIRKINNN